jgi:hypothetical protein
MALLRRSVPRVLRAHPLLVLALAAVLVGGGLRYVATSSASSGSTACATP